MTEHELNFIIFLKLVAS